MKISRKSWHYRLFDFYDTIQPKNFCGYFWLTVVLSFILPWFLICKSFFNVTNDSITNFGDFLIKKTSTKVQLVMCYFLWIGMFLFNLASLIGLVLFIFVLQGNQIFFSVIITLLALPIFFTIIISTIISVAEATKSLTNQIHYSSYHKEPGLFVSWIKAKKAKHCPLIEFTD